MKIVIVIHRIPKEWDYENKLLYTAHIETENLFRAEVRDFLDLLNVKIRSNENAGTLEYWRKWARQMIVMFEDVFSYHCEIEIGD